VSRAARASLGGPGPGRLDVPLCRREPARWSIDPVPGPGGDVTSRTCGTDGTGETGRTGEMPGLGAIGDFVDTVVKPDGDC
jgi:hypothetical protein